MIRWVDRVIQVSMAYGYPERRRRVESWYMIRRLAQQSSIPWCMIGDFNDLMFATKKRGGRSQPHALLQGFSDTVVECGLIDLGFEGECFTWEKFRGTDMWIQECLDIGLANREWMGFFPNAVVKVLEVSTSDHLPLFLDLSKKVYVPKEGLSAIINRHENIGLIHGCAIARGAPSISQLLFADDCYLFFRATEVEACTMKGILQRYENLSGQAINYTKSNISFSLNTSVEERSRICTVLYVQEVNVLGKYLGMPMYVGRNKNEVFGFLADRVTQKLQGWEKVSLSKGGKLTLLKTAAQAIPNFWMSLFLIPHSICDKIEKKMNGFWWGQGANSRGIRWMAWDKLCVLKYGGGLGGVNPSYLWRSILSAQDAIKVGCRRRIGDGTSTKGLSTNDDGFDVETGSGEYEYIGVGVVVRDSNEQFVRARYCRMGGDWQPERLKL
ncbi:hypothetical protein AgCh_029345 [Apium graveolens]